MLQTRLPTGVVHEDGSSITVTMTPYQHKLFQAVTARPNRVQMWVSRGDPMQKHKLLISLYARFFEIANQFNVQYWLEYGSSLGYCRHRGIMPWEWDMDIGCTSSNFKRLKEIAEILKDDKDFVFKEYLDEDYGTPGFSFMRRDDDTVLCDICEYLEVDDRLVCAVRQWNYPDFMRKDVFPLRRVVMLGESALIMHRAEEVLSGVQAILGQCTGSAEKESWTLNEVPWKQYDPIPFLLSHLFNPKKCELMVNPPCREIPVADSIAEGLANHGRQGRPFIVHNCQSLFRIDTQRMKQRALDLNITTWAWDVDMNDHKSIPVADLIDKWENDQLTMNLVDSVCDDLMTGVVDDAVNELGIKDETVQLVMAPNLFHTKFHCDPFLGDPLRAGGGWMYLSQGWKVWNLLDYDDAFATIYNRATRSLRDVPMDELLYLNHSHNWGKVWNGEIMDGDFLYFPPAMCHRVNTYQKSFGLGGYVVDSMRDAARIATATESFTKNGADGSAGLWKELSEQTD